MTKEEFEEKYKELYSKDRDELFKAIFMPFDSEAIKEVDKKEDKSKDYFHVCATCAYRKNIYGYSQCYAQKNAPKIENLDDTCDAWKVSDEE